MEDEWPFLGHLHLRLWGQLVVEADNYLFSQYVLTGETPHLRNTEI